MIQKYQLEQHIVMFTDIHGFSNAMSGLLCDSWPTFLQDTYETQGEIVVAHGGKIIKYLGDGLLCVFPADVADAAVRCALAMRTAFAELIARYHLEPETELEIGIAAGPVAIGTFGHSSLRLQDVFGVAVMHAAVIGHYRGVAVTKSVYEQIEAHFETRALPDIDAKRQAEPLQVWAVER